MWKYQAWQTVQTSFSMFQSHYLHSDSVSEMLPLSIQHYNALCWMKFWKDIILIIFRLNHEGWWVPNYELHLLRTNLCFSKKSISLLNLGIMVNVKILADFGKSYVQLFLCNQHKSKRWWGNRFQSNGKKILILSSLHL